MEGALTRRLLLAAASLALALGTVEAIGRWTCPPVRAPEGFVYDPHRGWAFPVGQEATWRGQRVRLNRLGLRGSDPAPDGDRLRVLLLGDSSAFGHDLEEDETISASLARLLSAERPADVQNGGVPGYTCPQSARLLDEVAPRYDPDVVVSYAMHSDARVAAEGDRLFLGAGPWGSLGAVRLATAVAQRIRLERGSAATWVGRYRDCLTGIATARRRVGGVVVFVVPIAKGDLLGPPSARPPPAPFLDDYREAAREVAAATGFPLVDLPALLAPGEARAADLMLDDVHPSSAGAAAIAVALWEVIRRLPPRTDR